MAPLQIPESTSTVKVSIIDTTVQMNGVPLKFFAGPELKEFDRINCCAYAFLVTHTDASTGKERRIVFDLGLPKDWENDIAPPMVDFVKTWGSDFKISKYVSEILEENEVPLDTLESVVWSHPHLDHIGRVSLFPPSVTLITGPGVVDALSPGYPTVPSSAILERDFKDRNIAELDFTTSTLKLGDLQAIDYFGDGSFYFLSAPGHCVGHINALARTTASSATDSKSTFMLMGGDSFHHASQLRPSEQLPLPENIPGPIPNFTQYANTCPGCIFDVVHPSHPRRAEEIPAQYTADIAARHNDPKTTPYMTISRSAEGQTTAIDLQAAMDTIVSLQAFDADDNILVVAAHDSTLFEFLDFFPKGANEWKAKGWKEKGQWRFLGDLKNAVDAANN